MLTSARARREEYVGPWLPETVVDTAALAPDSRTELAEDLSIALLLILDQLSPLDRALPAARRVRFLVQRSRHGAGAERGGVPTVCRRRALPRARSAATWGHRAAGAFGRDRCETCAAHVRIRGGNRVRRSQCADAVARERVVTDGGGKVRAALNVINGADRVAQFLVDATRKRPCAWRREDFTLRFATINGLVSSWTHPRGRCKLRRSRLRVTLYGRCTWCAIRTSYATCGRRDARVAPDERVQLIRVPAMLRAGDIGRDHEGE
jgi:RNA polymerase sigma-70 factor (ECF subfamily)